MSVLKVTTFVQTTALNVEIHGEVMNVYARKGSWRLTTSVSVSCRAMLKIFPLINCFFILFPFLLLLLFSVFLVALQDIFPSYIRFMTRQPGIIDVAFGVV